MNSDSDASQPPNAPRSRRNKDKKRNGGKGKRNGRSGKSAASLKEWTLPGATQSRLNERAQRFKDHLDVGSIAQSTRQINLLSSHIESNGTIVGTMQELEKPYLRLTKVDISSIVRIAIAFIACLIS